MDQLVVECDEEVEVGDEVVLLGRQGDEVVDADEWAARARHHQLGGPVRDQAAHPEAPRRVTPVPSRRWAPATLEALRRAGRDVHRVPPERDEDDGRLRRGGRPRAGCSSSARARAATRTCRASPSSGGPGQLLDRLRRRRARAHPGRLLHRERGEVPPARATATPLPDEVAACAPFLEGQLAPRRPARGRLARQRGDAGPARDRRGDLDAARPDAPVEAAGSSCRRSTPPTRCAAVGASSPRCARTWCARSRRSPRPDEPRSHRRVRLRGRHAAQRARARSPHRRARAGSWSSPAGSGRARRRSSRPTPRPSA